MLMVSPEILSFSDYCFNFLARLGGLRDAMASLKSSLALLISGVKHIVVT
jgi:hypothetical protein